MSPRLKKPVSRKKTEQEAIQVVEFVLGEEHYAIDLFDVKEVVECTKITRVPNVPPHVRGIIDLRGEITTIIDLKERLSISTSRESLIDTSRIIVLDDKITRSKTGILVDDVTSVSTFEHSQIDFVSVSATNDDAPILGIIKRKMRIKEKMVNELIIWLDIQKLLTE